MYYKVNFIASKFLHSMEAESSLLCSQVVVTCLYPQPGEFSQCPYINAQVYKVVSFPQVYTPKEVHFCCSSYMVCLISIKSYLICSLIVICKEQSCEAPHCAVFSSLPLLLLLGLSIFFSILQHVAVEHPQPVIFI